ncbi:MAG: hypothetical protein KGI37_01645 [Alphaproteobacteria bacterium]|nr:hypothetical protein [Alphaproteobacteria bacterium]
MFGSPAPSIASSLVHAIEDAVLLGNIGEIDGILDMVADDDRFPETLRYGLESLMYFRIYYGKGGALEPADDAGKQKTAQMESFWGRELIETIGHYPDLTESKYA